MKNGTCDICLYCVVQSSGELHCTRYPPTVSPVMAQGHLGQPEMRVMVLPINVASDYWCGEFKEIPAGLHIPN